jgi:sugar O-acyltransferase (sialic acid O-acetyltransferase NeuD family)
MKKPLIIFGNGEYAQLAHYYFQSSSTFEVQGFTVDEVYAEADSFCQLPLVPYEELSLHYSPSNFYIFIALGYSNLNELRKEKYLNTKSMGYKFANYISPNSIIPKNVNIGENCFIFENNVVQPFSTIGNNVTLWSGNHIGHHSTIADHCFVTSHAVISGGVTIGEQCFIGVNATIRDHISIGDKCVIGAGALILVDAASDGVYGRPATERSKVPSTRLRKI